MFPTIFQIDSFAINTLWLFFGIALISGTYTLIYLSVKQGLKIQFISEHFGSLILVSIAGARLIALLRNFDTYFYEFSAKTFLQIFYIWDKGLSFWGGALAFFLMFFWLCRKYEQSLIAWLDVLIPSILVGMAIGNVGAFFDGINYGRETSLPWGVNFENPSVKYTVPIHPTQIYAFIYTGFLSAVLILLTDNTKFRNLAPAGLLGLGGIAIYSFFRFLEEFVRGDDTITLLGIRLPQILALLICVSAGIFIFLRYNKKKSNLNKS